MNDALIKIQNLSFSYEPEMPVLRHIDLEVRKSERIALTGSNGAGKSTLLHLIVGLLHPASGRIEAFGRVRERERDFVEVRAKAGFLFQDADDQLFCPTVFEDVAFGPLNLGKSTEETKLIVSETLETLGLQGYEHRITYKLSGGEKRLVSLATVLAMKPEVLLLDEPTTGLDEDGVEHFVNVINRLPCAKLIVSQNHNLLPKVTDREIRIQKGCLTA